MKIIKTPVILFFSAVLFVLPFQVFALETGEPQYRWGIQGAYYIPRQESSESVYGIKEKPETFVPLGDDEGRDLGSSWGNMEIQAWTDVAWTIPLMQGSGAMTKNNNLKIREKFSLSPATLSLESIFSLTPVAFLVFEQGNHLGSGWSIPGMATGLGMNDDGTGITQDDPFPGIVYRGWFSGTFQFDLYEVLPEPNQWSHVVVTSTAKFRYQDYSAASSGQAWEYEADGGENHKGWQFSTSSILGLMIPNPVINFAGFMVDTSQNIGSVANMSPVADKGWGSDFTSVTLGPLFNWQINDNNGITFLVQWKNALEWQDGTEYYAYFKNRETSGKSYFHFERIAFSYTMKL